MSASDDDAATDSDDDSDNDDDDDDDDGGGGGGDEVDDASSGSDSQSAAGNNCAKVRFTAAYLLQYERVVAVLMAKSRVAAATYRIPLSSSRGGSRNLRLGHPLSHPIPSPSP